MSANGFETSLTAPPSPCDHVIFTDLDGLEGVLVDLNTKKYYQLNETASLIWRSLEQHLTVNRIAQEFHERYDVTIEDALFSIEKAVAHFAALRLVGSVNSKPNL